MSCGFTLVRGEARLALIHTDSSGAADPGFGTGLSGSKVVLVRPNGSESQLPTELWLPEAIVATISPTLAAGDYKIRLEVPAIGLTPTCTKTVDMRIETQPVSDLALAYADPIAVAPGGESTLRHPSPAFAWTQALHSPVELRDKDDAAVAGFTVLSGWNSGELVVKVPDGYQPPAPAHTIAFGGSSHRVPLVVLGDVQVPDVPDVPVDPSAVKLGVRLLASHFRVEKETWDHALEVDGKRDEVQIRVEVIELNLKGGGVKDALRSIETKVFGDVNSFPTRVQAGSASNKGGLKTGDEHPPADQRTGLHNDDLPLRIWEGTLASAGTAVLVVPTVWEIDDDRDPHLIQPVWGTVLPGLIDNARALLGGIRSRLQLPALPDALLQPLDQAARLGAGELLLTAAPGAIAFSRPSTWFVGHSGDRPVGLVDVGEGRHALVPWVLMLTYETALLMAQTGPADGNPLFTEAGAIVLRYRDGDDIGAGDYRLFLRLERT